MRLLIVIFILFIQVEAEDWSLAKEKGGITVYTRAVEGSGFSEFRGETVVNSNVDTLIAVMYDTKNAPEWLHECSFGVTLEEVVFEDNYIYQIYDLTFPVSNRQVILHSKLTYSDEGARLETVEANDFCDNKKSSRCQPVNENDLIKITKSRGYYQFIRINNKSTKVIWQQHIEPGGTVPKWLVNALVVDIPYNSLQALKELVEEEKYRDISKMKLKEMWLEEYQQFH